MWEIDDVVTPKKKLPDLRCGYPYKIIDIIRGIDGAYDWDDLILEGRSYRKYCEFDFKRWVSNNG